MNQTHLIKRRKDYKYPVITGGKGIYFYSKNKRYIDACGGAMVANLGYGVREIADKIGKLARKVGYLHGSQFITKEQEDYARDLCELTPLNRVLFVSGGSEAIETAVKLAIQYTGKHKIVSRIPAYHGSTILAASLSSKEVDPFKRLLHKFPKFSTFEQLEEIIKDEDIAAVILEPIIGTAEGVIIPHEDYLSDIRKLCNEYKVLLIFDETLTGFGRTGKWFACDHWNVTPDIMVGAKGLASGIVPLSAVFCKNKIIDGLDGDFQHGFTFENNPFTMGVGKIVLDYMKKNHLLLICDWAGSYLLDKLRGFSRDYEIVEDVRGIGLLVAIEFKKPIAKQIVQTAMKKGLNIYFSTDEKSIMIAPYFAVTSKEINKIIKILKEIINNN